MLGVVRSGRGERERESCVLHTGILISLDDLLTVKLGL